MKIWRSLLFVPANQERMLNKLDSLPADGFIFDLEDTIPDPEKNNARQMTLDVMPKVKGDRSWVRVNGLSTGFMHEDLDALIGAPGLTGLIVPKMDSLADVNTVDKLMASLEIRRGLTVGSTPIIVMMESAGGVLDSRAIMTSSPRIQTMIYGGGEDGDMNVSLGATWTSPGPEMMFVRQFSLVSARAANFDCPLDGVFANVKDPEGFRSDTQLSKRLGYRGRTVIHPNQIEDANNIYTPTAAQIEYYSRVVNAYQEALTRGVASTTVDGKLVDLAMSKTAQRLLDHVAAIKNIEAITGFVGKA
ncbi:HpcH/HpaI aldolase/citrate lyase family protein [Polynucleobacter kasalickyi]|uniref:Citrate lyase subunit beta / citryl-CoA lyase n=1 Tax=Polynucleobacter kasalickyi TaxID=1938817 RepID=A0A1W1Y269_9BURK|nr:CoA ester lyase [Polynucleobacter kasalickyi]SMC30246.1 citrate lyase subunit beta / citryl-CoA lyase [Polynucleobacter kasalickyi]